MRGRFHPECLPSAPSVNDYPPSLHRFDIPVLAVQHYEAGGYRLSRIAGMFHKVGHPVRREDLQSPFFRALPLMPSLPVGNPPLCNTSIQSTPFLLATLSNDLADNTYTLGTCLIALA